MLYFICQLEMLRQCQKFVVWYSGKPAAGQLHQVSAVAGWGGEPLPSAGCPEKLHIKRNVMPDERVVPDKRLKLFQCSPFFHPLL